LWIIVNSKVIKVDLIPFLTPLYPNDFDNRILS